MLTTAAADADYATLRCFRCAFTRLITRIDAAAAVKAGYYRRRLYATPFDAVTIDISRRHEYYAIVDTA